MWETHHLYQRKYFEKRFDKPPEMCGFLMKSKKRIDQETIVEHSPDQGGTL